MLWRFIDSVTDTRWQGIDAVDTQSNLSKSQQLDVEQVGWADTSNLY